MTDTPRALASQEASRPDPALGHPAAPGSLSASRAPFSELRAVEGSELPARPLIEDYAGDAYRACMRGAADKNQQQSAAAQIALLHGAKGGLLAALQAIDRAAVHQFTGCEADPMNFKRMPPELRAAIIAARAAVDRATGAKP